MVTSATARRRATMLAQPTTTLIRTKPHVRFVCVRSVEPNIIPVKSSSTPRVRADSSQRDTTSSVVTQLRQRYTTSYYNQLRRQCNAIPSVNLSGLQLRFAPFSGFPIRFVFLFLFCQFSLCFVPFFALCSYLAFNVFLSLARVCCACPIKYEMHGIALSTLYCMTMYASLFSYHRACTSQGSSMKNHRGHAV